MNETQPTAAERVQRLTEALNERLLAKEDARARIESLDTEIRAIRSTLSGISLGRQLAAEADASTK